MLLETQQINRAIAEANDTPEQVAHRHAVRIRTEEMLGMCDKCGFVGDCIRYGGADGFVCSECNETPERCFACKHPCRPIEERQQWVEWLDTRIPGEKFIGGS